ncbi:hypothetical protein CAC42_7672 [Sphaceloma murrayae]|uniref:DUF8004 domain-containing protein n=1 Tax=Sphaceloma murrayae TaxID=2082308 RepID=A0A2K1QTU4_9PEZI|nr:hypothetical protein CAC42_7672 [Sphaceloma murrayae]
MSSNSLPAERLHKSVPPPPPGASPPASREARSLQKPQRKALPAQVNPRTLPPALAADHGVFLPPPPLADPDVSKRHSSYDWTPTRPRTSIGSQGSTASTAGGRPMTPEGALKPPVSQKLRQSASATNLVPSTTMLQKEPKEEKKKKSWFGKSKDKADVQRRPGAWVVAPGQPGRIAFDVKNMMAGNPVPELWDDLGNCVIHLFPKASGKGPSFRIDSAVFASSPRLTKRAFGKIYSDDSDRTASMTSSVLSRGRDASGTFSTTSDTSRSAKSSFEDNNNNNNSEVHLWLDCGLNGKPAPVPPKKSLDTFLSEDEEALIGIRNLFAFLCGQSLVATERRFTLFSIFMRIADLLQHYEFSNMDSSSFGEAATTSFNSYISELGLADVRKSAQKTVEMIALGERMRSVALYNEAFAHAVGKHDEIQRLNLGTFKMVSETTKTRLQRAAMDLDKRVKMVDRMLTDFDFPAIFAGIGNSKTSDESKLVSFDAWKSSFANTRRFVMGYYKNKLGSWPPKPNPKKNELRTPGLNRLVLRELYYDLSAMYDLLVDRSDLTNRTADGVTIEDHATDPPRVRALRHLLSEYDRSTPPVKPPVPFDLPILPNLRVTRPEFGKDKKTDAKLLTKNLKTEEVTTLLSASHNRDALQSPFITAFLEHERAQAKGNNINEISDIRTGQWIFMYAVLQALPFLVIDVPAIQHTDKVEYFLCEASRGGVPWALEVRETKYYAIAGGGGVVSLPSDVIENSVEGIYRRSHCWIMAEKWTQDDPLLNAAVHEQQQHHGGLPPPPSAQALSDATAPGFRDSRQSSLGSDTLTLAPPPIIPAAAGEARVDSRSSSPSRSKRESVLNLGLQAIPLPRGASPSARPRSMVGSPMDDYLSAGSGGQVGTPGQRPVSVVDQSKTFDAILGGMQEGKGKGKKQ